MGLPEEEKAVLVDSVLNIDSGLYSLGQLLNSALGSLGPVKDNMRKAGLHELNDQLNEALESFDVVKENITSLRKHAKKAYAVVDAIRKGAI